MKTMFRQQVVTPIPQTYFISYLEQLPLIRLSIVGEGGGAKMINLQLEKIR